MFRSLQKTLTPTFLLVVVLVTYMAYHFTLLWMELN